MRLKMKKIKENKGITLIALVITILVLLILAGVSIQILSGSNGIVSKARKSSSANMYIAILERLNLELNNLLIPTASNDYNYTGKVTLREYVDALKGQDEDGVTLMEDDESNVDAIFIEQGYVTFTIGGYVYEIEVNKIENIDESIEDEFSKYYVIGSEYVAKQSEAGPRIDVELTSTSNQITASVKYSNIDEKGTFNYYYKEQGDNEYKLARTQTGVTENPTTYTFEGLQQDKIYDIKIVATNSNKISTTKILSKRTGKVIVAEGNIEFGEVSWNATEHTASVTINKGAGITGSIQYQIGGTSGEWQNGSEVTGIQNGQTVYARLWDGTKYAALSPYKCCKVYNNNSSHWNTWNVDVCTVLSSSTYSKGTNLCGTVTSTNENEYPANGYQSGYWYVKQ